MPLQVTQWVARLHTQDGYVYLPIDIHYKPNEQGFDNHVPLSRLGPNPSWYFFVDFPALDPQHADYPHFAEVHDNQDFGVLKFNSRFSTRAGVQANTPGSYGPIPTGMGKHVVRFVLLNKNRHPLLSQSSHYFIDYG